MNLPGLVWKCTSDALMSLGEPTMQSLVWHVNNGAPVGPEEFDIVKFEIALREMVGGGRRYNPLYRGRQPGCRA